MIPPNFEGDRTALEKGSRPSRGRKPLKEFKPGFPPAAIKIPPSPCDPLDSRERRDRLHFNLTVAGEISQRPLAFRALRNADALEGKCGDCEFRHVCGGSGARTFAFSAGNPLAHEPDCAYIPST